MKPMQVVKVDSDDEDTHFVFIELEPLEKNNCAQNYNEIEVKKSIKKGSIKTPYLKRTE
jgi:hypothetical protein